MFLVPCGLIVTEQKKKKSELVLVFLPRDPSGWHVAAEPTGAVRGHHP